MEDVVAVEVMTARETRPHYFLTWGRIQDAVDPEPLERLLRAHVERQCPVQSVSVCQSLSEAAGARYFYEALLHFARERVPFGPAYSAWAEQKRQAMAVGKEIYDCGTPLDGA